MATAETYSRSFTVVRSDQTNRTTYLIVDTESVPDLDLIMSVRYPGLPVEEAHARIAHDYPLFPVSFQVPVAVTVLRVSADYHLQSLALLDAPQFRPAEITRKFWYGCSLYPQSRIVTFNGRSFDLPLMELAAYRFGYSMGDYVQSSRNRFTGTLDLHDWLTNFGAANLAGGLDLLAKLLGKPGRFETVSTEQLHREGRIAEINSYCLCDTLDTYFVFLRTRVMTGELTREAEVAITNDAREYLEGKSKDYPILGTYLATWK